jgi:ribosomal-protein-alanine N-acetyltransferase
MPKELYYSRAFYKAIYSKLLAMLKLQAMRKMAYIIRPMKDEDIPQVAEIDREAFPSDSLFSSYTSYQQDLHSPLARYIVASSEKEAGVEVSEQNLQSLPWLKRLFSHNRSSSKEYIVGFVSFWLMLKEAHLTAIAVRSDYRHSGIGERLLISAIELATQLNAEVISLEVRVSNKIAQALYKKYSFQAVGRRPRYYSDNAEDAVLMSIYAATSAPFQAYFQQLKEAHSQKWGQAFAVTQLT